MTKGFDSHLPLVADLELLTETGASRWKLPAHKYLRGISLKQPSEGAWTATIDLYDDEGGELEELMLGSRGQTQPIRFMFGKDDDQTNPYFTGSIIRYTPEFTPEGVGMTLEIVPTELITTNQDKFAHSFKPQMFISDIVSAIAAYPGYGWKTEDPETGIRTIEETKEAMAQPFSCQGQSALKFIRDYLVPRAVSKETGQGAYRFYIDRNNVVHFHTSDYLARRGAYTHRFRFGRDNFGTVKDFKPTDNSVFAAIFGSTNATYRGSNAVTADRQVITTTANQDPSGNAPSAPADSTGRPNPSDKSSYQRFLVARDRAAVAAIAQYKYDMLRQQTFTAEMTILGSHDIRTMDYVFVEYVKKSGNLHYLSGTFQVLTVEHEFKTGDWTTKYTMQRAGVTEGQTTTTGQVLKAPDAET